MTDRTDDRHAPTTNAGVFSRVEALVKIITGASLVIGIAVGIWGPGGLIRADKKMKLDSLAPIKELVTADFETKQKIVALDWSSLEEAVCSSLEANRTGHDTYFSPAEALSKLRSITEHYERMGAMVALNYIQFDLIFEVISFPDDFWLRLSRVRGVLAEKWRSQQFEKRALPDLWSNFYQLCERYQDKRQRLGSPTVPCRNETQEAARCLYTLPASKLPSAPTWRERLFWS
jgi:hypothetical protein